MWRAGWIMGVGFTLIAGCSHCHDCPARHQAFGPDRAGSYRTPAPMQLSSSLLFNPGPSAYAPDSFAYRSDWPSTQSYYQDGQFIFFRERFYDVQGLNLNPNYTYRRFETYRSGFGYR